MNNRWSARLSASPSNHVPSERTYEGYFEVEEGVRSRSVGPGKARHGIVYMPPLLRRTDPAWCSRECRDAAAEGGGLVDVKPQVEKLVYRPFPYASYARCPYDLLVVIALNSLSKANQWGS